MTLIFTIVGVLIVWAGVDLARGLNKVIEQDMAASADAEEVRYAN